MDASRPLGLSPGPRKRKTYVTLAALLLLAVAGLVLAAIVATHPADPHVLMRTGARPVAGPPAEYPVS